MSFFKTVEPPKLYLAVTAGNLQEVQELLHPKRTCAEIPVAVPAGAGDVRTANVNSGQVTVADIINGMA